MYNNKYNFGEINYIWNPWKGCFRLSEACENCYVKPINTFKDNYCPFPYEGIKDGTVITVCLSSDFFLLEADKYRDLAWDTIMTHPNLIFLIITKRIERVAECLPENWGDGWNNVIIAATTETQARADERIPILLDLPLKHRWLACSPLLEELDLAKYLSTGKIEVIETLGERGYDMPARPTKYEWMVNLQKQCAKYDVWFGILFIGHNFIMPDGSVIRDDCRCYHSPVADSLNLFHYKPITFKLKDLEVTY